MVLVMLVKGEDDRVGGKSCGARVAVALSLLFQSVLFKTQLMSQVYGKPCYGLLAKRPRSLCGNASRRRFQLLKNSAPAAARAGPEFAGA
jgi:hypothetical protein